MFPGEKRCVGLLGWEHAIYAMAWYGVPLKGRGELETERKQTIAELKIIKAF